MTMGVAEVLSSEIRQITDAILSATPAKAIYLFGSRARGIAHQRSDYDILVLTDYPRPRGDVYFAIEQAFGDTVRVPVDVVILSPRAFERNKHVVNALSQIVAEEGILLYGE